MKTLKKIIIAIVVVGVVFAISVLDFSEQAIEHGDHTERLTRLTFSPQTIKAGQEMTFLRRMPVFGMDMQLCFAIGNPIDSKNPDPKEQEEVRGTINYMLNIIDGADGPVRPDRVFEGKVKNLRGAEVLMRSSALTGSNIPMDKEKTVLQIGFCAPNSVTGSRIIRILSR